MSLIKRILSLLLLTVFTLTVVGVEVEKLYCDGKLSKTGVELKPCCKQSACCEVESDFYVLTGNYEASDFAFEFRSLLLSIYYSLPPQLVFYFPPFSSI